MPDTVELNTEAMTKLIQKLKNFGVEVASPMVQVIDWGSSEIVNHMRAHHFFVGTAKGCTKRAEANVFTFKNADGSPRFNVRTQVLVRSMQFRAATIGYGTVEGTVFIGAEYAADVEYGAPGRRAFPYLRPAVEATKPRIVSKLMKKYVELARKHLGTNW